MDFKTDNHLPTLLLVLSMILMFTEFGESDNLNMAKSCNQLLY